MISRSILIICNMLFLISFTPNVLGIKISQSPCCDIHFKRCPVFATYIKRNYVCKLHAFLRPCRTDQHLLARITLQLSHGERNGVSIVCLTVCSGVNIKAPHHWLFVGNPPVTDGFSQRASNRENVSIWWRHHGMPYLECEVINAIQGIQLI